MIRVRSYQKVKEPSFMLVFQTSGQDVYKWLWSWVTAIQVQLLVDRQ